MSEEAENNSSIKLICNEGDKECIGDVLLKLCKEASEDIVIISPYITHRPIIEVAEDLKAARIRLLTKLSLKDFIVGASDIDVLLGLARNPKVKLRYYTDLHAKIYLFDKRKAVITSANFTDRGLSDNLEYGVLIEGAKAVEISNYVEDKWGDAERLDVSTLSNLKAEICSTDLKTSYEQIKESVKKHQDKLIKPHRSHRLKDREYPSTSLHSEDEALRLAFERSRLSPEDAEKAERAYYLLKYHIPKEARTCSFRLNKGNYIGVNYRNYRLFALPGKKRRSVWVIYPEDDIDNLLSILSRERLQEIREYIYNRNEIFSFFPCVGMVLFLDEVLRFSSIHWDSFRKACQMAVGGRNTRRWESNIAVDWNYYANYLS
jgi:HKD family nuclease